jgi:biotin carboxylase
MVEEYVRGPQLSTESIVQDGEVFTLGCSDRNYEHLERFAPYLIENGGLLPSVHADAHGAEVDRVLCDAAAALGLERGVLKGDIVLDPVRGPVVIEVAPRLSGGWLCTDQIPWATGVELVQLAARLALGETLASAELVPRRQRAIAVRYFFPPAGVLRAVAGFEEVAALPWIRRAMLFVRPGEVIAPVTDHTKRAGVVLAAGDDGEEAVRRAEEAAEAVRFEVTENVAMNARS